MKATGGGTPQLDESVQDVRIDPASQLMGSARAPGIAQTVSCASSNTTGGDAIPRVEDPQKQPPLLDRLPLASVRTFALVARLLSISRAAEELSVTPSAVSHQIKLLESYLDTRLFKREKNKLKLTSAGEQYMVQISEALLLLGVATKRLKAVKDRQVLRVGCTPSLSLLWLIPRLEAFMKVHPQLEVTVTGVPDPTAIQHDAFDIAFWYGSGSISGFVVEPLGANRMFPICKRALAEGERGLRTPADLARNTIIECSDETYYRYDEQRDGWKRWFDASGAKAVTPKNELNFTPRVLMHKAVIAGLGVGMSRTLLAADALAAKEIVIPFGPALATTASYNVVVATHIAKRKDVAAFRTWVLEEAAASTRKLERLLNKLARA